MHNYFELFDLDVSFAIDKQALKQSYQLQIAKHHPDKFTLEAEDKRLAAEQNSALINSAFDIIHSPLKRANYLLELQGVDAFSQTDTNMNESFLVAQIELREELELIEQRQDELQLDDFVTKVTTCMDDNIENLGVAFTKDKELNVIKNLVRELKFYQQLKSQAQSLLDNWL